jgi:saposin
VPVDTDSICKICLDMVGQARDQLESNETMEEIREVFDGSCDLIPLKIVKTECKKLADDFIPEMVEALASQMNPQVSRASEKLMTRR